MDKLGHVFVTGQLNADAGVSQTLQFAFRNDQTLLPPLVAATAELMKEMGAANQASQGMPRKLGNPEG